MADANDSLETLQVSEADRQMIELAKGLANDPKTRKKFLALVKEKHPDQPIPELDTQADIEKFAKPYIDKLAKMEKDMLERDTRARIADRRADLKGQGFSDDDVKAIEEYMVKEQIPNYATAAKHYKNERILAQPTPAAKDMVTRLPVDKKTIKEAGGIKNWARTEASKAVDDLKSGRVKLH